MTWRKITALRNQELEGGHKLSILLGTEWHQTKIACLSFNGPSNKSGKKDNEKIKRRGLELSSSQPSMKKHLVCLVISRWWWIRSESRFSFRCCFLYVHIICCCSSCLWLRCSFFNCDVRKNSPFWNYIFHMLRKLWMRSKACCDDEQLARP